MSRRHLTFGCQAETLAATLDDAQGSTGLLLVSGGSEIRSGAFGGQAELAALIAAHGHPVFRFDRRGIGDSSGDDPGFAGSGPDIAAALAAFRSAALRVARVIAFGNCDAASALMLTGGGGCDGLVLANAWVIERDDGASPPAAIRARYTAKLGSPRELGRLFGGKVSLDKLFRGLARAFGPAPAPAPLAGAIGEGLARFAGPVHILVAERDRAAQAFLAAWDPRDPRIRRCAGASHGFAEEGARAWLLAQVLEALSE